MLSLDEGHENWWPIWDEELINMSGYQCWRHSEQKEIALKNEWGLEGHREDGKGMAFQEPTSRGTGWHIIIGEKASWHQRDTRGISLDRSPGARCRMALDSGREIHIWYDGFLGVHGNFLSRCSEKIFFQQLPSRKLEGAGKGQACETQ